MNQNPQQVPRNTQQTQPRKNNKKLYLIIGFAILLPLIIIGILAVMVTSSMSTSKDKAKDAQVKSSVSLTRTSAEAYFDGNQTYKGFLVNSSTQSTVESAGSKIIIQGLSDKSYVIYAKLPSSDKLYCIDSAEFIGEIATIQPTQTTCQ